MYAWEQIQIVIDYIEGNLKNELTIEELSEKALLSPFYFQRLFKELVKKPVFEYIKLRRLAKASIALNESKASVLNIAIEYGFSSHEVFTRAFKETFGYTPSSFRKEKPVVNVMIKPNLLLNYTIIDEGVPLVTDGIVLEINRKEIKDNIYYVGKKLDLPYSYLSGLGTESGIDPLYQLWEDFHNQKESIYNIESTSEEIGVTYQSDKKGYFSYFAGGKTKEKKDDELSWIISPGEYVVCSFEAPTFNELVMDALYKVNQYLYNIWLPKHNIITHPFCIERYQSHGEGTTKMEIILKIVK